MHKNGMQSKQLCQHLCLAKLQRSRHPRQAGIRIHTLRVEGSWREVEVCDKVLPLHLLCPTECYHNLPRIGIAVQPDLRGHNIHQMLNPPALLLSVPAQQLHSVPLGLRPACYDTTVTGALLHLALHLTWTFR